MDELTSTIQPPELDLSALIRVVLAREVTADAVEVFTQGSRQYVVALVLDGRYGSVQDANGVAATIRSQLAGRALS